MARNNRREEAYVVIVIKLLLLAFRKARLPDMKAPFSAWNLVQYKLDNDGLVHVSSHKMTLFQGGASSMCFVSRHGTTAQWPRTTE